MRREPDAYLHDIDRAAKLIVQFTAGRTFIDYLEDRMLRSAVERQFEIIGEALAQLAKADAAKSAQIRECRRIIAFRNTLIHGYADVDNRLVWDIIESMLPALQDDVVALLRRR